MATHAPEGELAAPVQPLSDTGGGPWEALAQQLWALSGEYLFFLGACLLAALCLVHRRWLASALSFGLAVLWLTFHLPVTLYLESLGADSFAETQRFDWTEARFWMQTLREAVQPDFSPKKFAAYLLVALLAATALWSLLARRAGMRRAYVASKLALALACMGLALHQTGATAMAFYLENSEKFHATAANFTQPPPAVLAPAQPMELYVYIGESTSVMNMSLYGYPRPTTPRLDALAASDPALVVFDHVFATHAHTSRSLLEALSFGVDPAQAYLPITERQRVSVVDVLRSGGVEPRLISNQGLGGSWDQASSVIFRQSHNTFRSRVNLASGADAPVWDDAFFAAQLDALPAPAGSRVLFLHSYSGHGPYYKNIPPEFRRPVDGKLQTWPRAQVVADAAASVAQIEEYDAATRYVDHSVSRMIERVRALPRSAALVYFSDHGDAVFAGIGHDSARFRHEMARVPFLIYLNEAAQRSRPGLLARYQQRARDGATATLAQLPSTLLELLGARIAPADAQAVLQTPVIGEPAALPPVMVREVAEGITYVRLGGPPAPTHAPTGQRLIDRTDADTRRYLAERRAGRPAGAACPPQPQPPTLEALARQVMLLGCRANAPDLAQATP